MDSKKALVSHQSCKAAHRHHRATASPGSKVRTLVLLDAGDKDGQVVHDVSLSQGKGHSCVGELAKRQCASGMVLSLLNAAG